MNIFSQILQVAAIFIVAFSGIAMGYTVGKVRGLANGKKAGKDEAFS